MWVLLTLLTAVCTAVRDAASKQATRTVPAVVVAFWIALIPAVALSGIVVAAAVLGPGPAGSLAAASDARFLTALAISGGINAIATPLVVWALGRSDLSLVAPLTSLTPLFMLGTAAVVLGERPSPAGGIGVAVIVAGAYLLNVSDRQASPFAPFTALLQDPGARAMLLVAFLYSISAAFDKVGVQASSPLVWAAAVHVVVALGLGPLAVRHHRAASPGPRPPPPRPAPAPRREGSAARPGPASGLAPRSAILLAGAVLALGIVAQNIALTLTLAAYVIAVKRTSTLFGVLLGYSLFKEQQIRERLLGAAVMLAGFILVTLS